MKKYAVLAMILGIVVFLWAREGLGFIPFGPEEPSEVITPELKIARAIDDFIRITDPAILSKRFWVGPKGAAGLEARLGELGIENPKLRQQITQIIQANRVKFNESLQWAEKLRKNVHAAQYKVNVAYSRVLDRKYSPGFSIFDPYDVIPRLALSRAKESYIDLKREAEETWKKELEAKEQLSQLSLKISAMFQQAAEFLGYSGDVLEKLVGTDYKKEEDYYNGHLGEGTLLRPGGTTEYHDNSGI